MALQESSYIPPVKGLATSFAETELPPEFAAEMENLFQNQSGGAEKRRGLVQTGNTLAGNPKVTDITELVSKDNTRTLFAGAGGQIYKFDGVSTWTSLHTFPTASATIDSVMMSGKLIFFNGEDPNIFTADGTNFFELKSLIEVGQTTSNSSAIGLTDADFGSGNSSWLVNSNVLINDLLYNVDLDAYGIITVVATASVGHTVIGSVAEGGTGLGLVDDSVSSTVSYRYEIIDLVENNIIPTTNVNEDDNEATAGPGTSAKSVAVSGIVFSDRDIRVGDYIRNTTIAAVTRVTSVATAVGVHGVSGQTSGDALIFLKTAMPIIKDASVHYNRLYAVDSRDLRRIRISSPNNPQDFTSDAAALDINSFPIGSTAIDKQSFDTGALQPEGDVIIAIRSFQRFLVLLGRSNIYFYEGIEPVGTAKDITPIGLYPQGCVNRLAATNLGNDFIYVTPEGVRNVSLNRDASTFNQTLLSNQLDTTLRDLIKANTGDTDIQLIYYRRRSWLLVKIGSELYLYNFAPIVLQGQEEAIIGSWHLFTGGFARQTAYFVRQDGTLMCGDDNGVISEFDTEVFDDVGEIYSTRLKTGWLNMKEPKFSVKTKVGHYIKPQVVAGGDTTLTVEVEAPYNRESTDTAVIGVSGVGAPIGQAVIGTAVIGGSGVVNDKYPLHWRGEVARFLFRTNDTEGPLTISKYTLYYTEAGKQ